MKTITAIVLLLASVGMAVTTNYVVQINEAGTQTIPPNTIATPGQVESVAATASELHTTATNAAAMAAACAESTVLYSTNYVVTSTVYVQSIGGVPYDPSNQTIRVQSISTTSTNISIVATVKQLPLTAPVLDWRAALNAGAWSNITASVGSTDIPAGVTNAAAAYLFTLARPEGTGSAFFRVVDNSSGASGSGLWWLVYGGIWVDGQQGKSGTVTNGTDELRFVGGILVEPEPLGGG